MLSKKGDEIVSADFSLRGISAEAADMAAKIAAMKGELVNLAGSTGVAQKTKLAVEGELALANKDLATVKQSLISHRHTEATYEREIGDLGSRLATLQDEVEAAQKKKDDLSTAAEQESAKRDALVHDQAAMTDAHQALLLAQRQEIAVREAEATEKLAIADARIEGLDLYLDGGIFFRDGLPNYRVPPTEEFRARMSPASDWLREQMRRMESKIARDLALADAKVAAIRSKLANKMALAEAMVEAVRGWAGGILFGINDEVNADKLPLFDMVDGPEADALFDKIKPFRTEVADVMRELPNRWFISKLAELATTLGPKLHAEDQAQANAFRNLNSRLWQQKKEDGQAK